MYIENKHTVSDLKYMKITFEKRQKLNHVSALVIAVVRNSIIRGRRHFLWFKTDEMINIYTGFDVCILEIKG